MSTASNAAMMAKLESQVLAEYAAVAANLDHVSRARRALTRSPAPSSPHRQSSRAVVVRQCN